MKHVIIIPPSFSTQGLLDPLVKHLRDGGVTVQTIIFSPASDGDTIRSRVKDAWDQIPSTSRDVRLIGISSGGVVAKIIADEHPECISGVILYGTPMLCQKMWKPVWLTLAKYILRGYLFKALIGRGVGRPNKKDGEDWLWGGVSHSQGDFESWKLIREMIFGNIPPSKSGIRYTVVGVTKEFFHRWEGAVEWTSKSTNSACVQIKGSHFGALNSKVFLDLALREALR